MNPNQAPEWMKRHEADDDRRFKEIAVKLETLPDDQRTKEIFHETLVEFFTSSGKIGRNIIVTTAVIVTSLIAIGGGVKVFLAWLGWGYIAK